MGFLLKKVRDGGERGVFKSETMTYTIVQSWRWSVYAQLLIVLLL